MKNQITALVLVAVAALAFAPKPAQAGDREIAAIGGFIGGLIVGSVINDHRDHNDATVIVHDRGPGHYHQERGYWKEVTVRHWVPDTWEYRYEYGRRIRVFVPGHWVMRRDRVWVAHNRPGYRRW